MATVFVRLTVFFEDPFWVGVLERNDCGLMQAVKVIFGPEPKDYEVYDWFAKNLSKLKFGPAMAADERMAEVGNPKRLQREIKKRTQQTGVGTKSQKALSMQREAMKEERRVQSRDRRDAELEYRFALRQAKRKEKHRGH